MDATETDDRKAVDGVWTPHALVLCYECHGPTFDRGSMGVYTLTEVEWAQATGKRASKYGDRIGTCDQCDDGVWIGASVSICMEARDIINTHDDKGLLTASLEQTGGMCCATRIEIEWTKNFYVYATDSEETSDDAPPSWKLAVYSSHSDEDALEGTDYPTVFAEELIPTILRLLEAAKVKDPRERDIVARHKETTDAYDASTTAVGDHFMPLIRAAIEREAGAEEMNGIVLRCPSSVIRAFMRDAIRGEHQSVLPENWIGKGPIMEGNK